MRKKEDIENLIKRLEVAKKVLEGENTTLNDDFNALHWTTGKTNIPPINTAITVGSLVKRQNCDLVYTVNFIDDDDICTLVDKSCGDIIKINILELTLLG